MSLCVTSQRPLAAKTVHLWHLRMIQMQLLCRLVGSVRSTHEAENLSDPVSPGAPPLPLPAKKKRSHKKYSKKTKQQKKNCPVTWKSCSIYFFSRTLWYLLRILLQGGVNGCVHLRQWCVYWVWEGAVLLLHSRERPLQVCPLLWAQAFSFICQQLLDRADSLRYAVTFGLEVLLDFLQTKGNCWKDCGTKFLTTK